MQFHKFSVFWFFGITGAGKTTMADSVCLTVQSRENPNSRGGWDRFRKGLGRDLGFTSEDRLENIRRAAGKAYMPRGICGFGSFMTPESGMRSLQGMLLVLFHFMKFF